MSVASVHPPIPRASWPVTVGHLLTHGLLGVGLMVVLVLVVPSFKKVFEDFKVPLPASAVAVFNFSEWCCTYLVFAGGLLILFLVMDGLILIGLRHQLHRPGLGRVWSALVLLSITGVLGVVLLAMRLPYTELMEGLSM